MSHDEVIRPTESQIRELAYKFWDKRRGDGFDSVDWYHAEKKLLIDLNYDLAAWYPFETCDEENFGYSDDPTCRYCGRKRPTVRFRKGNAHAIPDFLGNDKLFSYDECVTCNGKFSNYETSFGDLTLSLRKYLGIRNPKVPSETLNLNLKNKTLSFANNQKISVYPIKIFKLLTKCALAVMPAECLFEFNRAIEWIGEKDHSKLPEGWSALPCYFSSLPGPILQDVSVAALYFRNSAAALPGALFMLRVRNIAFQIPIPLCNFDGNRVTLPFPFNPPFPVFSPEHGRPHSELHVLNSHEKTPIGNVVQMKFGSFDLRVEQTPSRFSN